MAQVDEGRGGAAHADPDFGALEPPLLRCIERGIKGAVAFHGELNSVQAKLLDAVGSALLGVELDVDAAEPMGENALAAALQDQDVHLRERVVQLMIMLELILHPLPQEVADQVARYADALGVDDAMLKVAREYAEGSFGLALVDLERNGYFADFDQRGRVRERLHTQRDLMVPFENDDHDEALAARWHALEHLGADTLGRKIWEYYVGRGFIFPGEVGSVSPMLAQHDWIHVLADYGTVIDSELETFGFISAAIPEARGFSFLATVIGLFETGFIDEAAGGVLQTQAGHIAAEGMPVRLADALRRGRLCNRDVILGLDYFDHVAQPIDEVRAALDIVPKSAAAIAAGSVGVWAPGGITAYQREHGDARFQPPDGTDPDR